MCPPVFESGIYIFDTYVITMLMEFKFKAHFNLSDIYQSKMNAKAM